MECGYKMKAQNNPQNIRQSKTLTLVRAVIVLTQYVMRAFFTQSEQALHTASQWSLP